MALDRLYAFWVFAPPESPLRGRSVENSPGGSAPRQAILATPPLESFAEMTVLIPSARRSSRGEKRQ